ncbi:MAG: ABC transporter permease [Candidatus Aminicenantes bacterium]|nr:ABC transporter permease [Candidatus Aminicenantes bacterium]NLH76520.1 ABC transporter permease [Acidobacteriota bacterium]
MSRTVSLPKRFRAPEVVGVLDEIRRLEVGETLVLDFGQVEEFDGSTLAFLGYAGKEVPGVSVAGVPEPLVRAREALACPPDAAWPAKPAAPSGPGRPGRFFRAYAERFLGHARNLGRFLAMLGDEVFHVGGYLRERKGVYPGETWNQMYFMGYQSYPIVCLLLFLVGVTISITSAEQLRVFGADAFIADIIGYAMLRELVPLMAGVILAGKVGAAVTAELASMTVLEEVDALRTMGLVPEKFLMVPRLLAITLVVPLLVAMADVAGILGGMVVARITFGMLPAAFLDQMVNTVGWVDFAWGLVKTVVFGWAVVVGAGFKGLTVGRSAEEVGRATTESVVLSITLIIVLDCVFAFVIY